MHFDKIYALVSGQPLPLLLPLFDPLLKPNTVVLLATPQIKATGTVANLTSIIQPEGIKVEVVDIDNAYDIESLGEVLDTMLKNDAALGLSVALNATGGTKPMSIAAYTSFYNASQPVFYVDNTQLTWLYADNLSNALKAHQKIEAKLNEKQFLLAHGQTIKETSNGQIPPELKAIGNRWLKNTKKLQGSLGALNTLAAKAEKTLTVEMRDQDINSQELQNILDELDNADILSVKGKKITFKNEQARFFANGGWLEVDILSRLQSLKKENPGITSVKGSANISNGSTRNELDAICIKNGTLVIFECKTKNMERDKNTVSDSLYKLDSLSREIGGIRTKCILVSFRKINNADKQRAKQMRIDIIQAQELHDIDSRLRTILSMDDARSL